MIDKPKKERRFIKTLGNIGLYVFEQILKKGGDLLIKRIGGKKTLPSILFLLLSFSLFAQYPATGNKQRLGYQTTADGLVWRGRASDTVALKSTGLNNAYIIIDTLTNVMYNYIKTKGGWLYNNSDTIILTLDTISLSNRIDLKVNISDTAAMLLPYASKLYADTSGRFYARQDYLNVQSAILTWAQSDTLIAGNSEVLQVYRNGQILLPTQYTVNSSTQLTIATTSFKVGENYTVIFPRGGGASQGGSGGGSGTVTSITAGTGLTGGTITTSGTIAADLTVLMELTDTVSLSNRIDTKLNVTDTASLSNRIDTKQNTISLTTNGISGASTLINDVLNIPQYSGGGGGGGTVTIVEALQPINIDQNNQVNPRISIVSANASRSGSLTNTDQTIAGVKTFNSAPILASTSGTATSILGKTSTNSIASVTLGSGLSLTSGTLDATGGSGTVTNVSGTGTVNGISLSGTVTTTGSLTLGGTLSNVNLGTQVTGTLPIANGGTAATTAPLARTSLGATVRGANVFTLPDISTLSFLRYNADNTVNQRTAVEMRGDLGGTTIGQSMFTLTNPSAITFPRFNADNTVTALSATNFRTAIGAGTGNGNGSVTSVGLSIGETGTDVNVSNTPITGSGTITLNIPSASSSNRGLVTTGVQTFAGDKNFNGVVVFEQPVAFYKTISRPLNIYTSNTTISLSNGWIICNGSSTIQLTLPSPINQLGMEFHLKTITANSVTNNLTNISPLNGGSTTSTILPGIDGAWCTLVSDGSQWVIMASNF